jgi:cell division protein FtsW (lipid II flippase)
VSATATPARDRALSPAQVRLRWRMGTEARGLILVMAVLLSFGLAVLYSASAIDAMQRNRESWYYFARQLSGVGIGMIAFAFAAKLDAERFRAWAWPIMWITIVTLLLCLVLPRASHRGSTALAASCSAARSSHPSSASWRSSSGPRC